MLTIPTGKSDQTGFRFFVVCLSLKVVTSALLGTDPAVLIEPDISEKDLSHWAFQPIKALLPPKVKNETQVQNSIDRFILARLEEKDLGLMPAADKRTLIRRVSFDLRGLPPTREEVNAFVADASPRAYKDLVDQYLASPAYGERWAQHWLDTARFGESDGFEHDEVRKEAWRYRDWVINALNEDMPYDQFITEQIAGDELYPGKEDAGIATGFLVAGPDMPDINLMEERRHTVLNEMTSTAGAVLMGMTMGCAQCHDHKFDPISQADFYRMRAVFSDLTIPEKSKQLNHVFSPLDSGAPPSHLMLRGDFRFKGPEVSPAFLRIANPKKMVVPAATEKANVLSRRLAFADWLTDTDHPLTRRVIVNRLWQHYFNEPIVGTPNDFGLQGDRPTHPELLDWLAMELVKRDWSLKEIHRLILLSATYQQVSRPVDTSWERAIKADPDNQLLSRMNRKRLEGEAIRDAMLAVSNKLNSKMGGPGVHPPLPHEVANTLLQKQWEVSEDENDHYRRSIYLFVRRNLRFPMFDVFDRPDANASCGRRNTSTTAPQSLTLLNSEFSIQSARRLAGVIVESGNIDTQEWVSQCYERLFARPPTDEERGSSVAFIENQATLLKQENRDLSELATPFTSIGEVDPYRGAALTDFCLAMFNINEMIYLD
ncbi:MAG: DUF1549 and DUF1553 domain-containing protein [Verrucomicrobia bacterium]|nr:DUF1549 and DUF1553 domain-containing protein [Verrucomicrobiota bacterium]